MIISINYNYNLVLNNHIPLPEIRIESLKSQSLFQWFHLVFLMFPDDEFSRLPELDLGDIDPFQLLFFEEFCRPSPERTFSALSFHRQPIPTAQKSNLHFDAVCTNKKITQNPFELGFLPINSWKD
jgi:hypothetical protein